MVQEGITSTAIMERGKTMTLREFLRELAVRGEVILSVEDDFPDAKIIHIDPPLDHKIVSMYGERIDNGRTEK